MLHIDDSMQYLRFKLRKIANDHVILMSLIHSSIFLNSVIFTGS